MRKQKGASVKARGWIRREFVLAFTPGMIALQFLGAFLSAAVGIAMANMSGTSGVDGVLLAALGGRSSASLEAVPFSQWLIVGLLAAILYGGALDNDAGALYAILPKSGRMRNWFYAKWSACLLIALVYAFFVVMTIAACALIRGFELAPVTRMPRLLCGLYAYLVLRALRIALALLALRCCARLKKAGLALIAGMEGAAYLGPFFNLPSAMYARNLAGGHSALSGACLLGFECLALTAAWVLLTKRKLARDGAA